jgi:hypothetical protein
MKINSYNYYTHRQEKWNKFYNNHAHNQYKEDKFTEHKNL